MQYSINNNKARREAREKKDGGDEGYSFGQVVKGGVRFATMPFAVMKDLMQGGVIRAGKNFVPRCRNAAKGDSLVSHADYKKKPNKSGGGNKPSGGNNNPPDEGNKPQGGMGKPPDNKPDGGNKPPSPGGIGGGPGTGGADGIADSAAANAEAGASGAASAAGGAAALL